MTISCLPRHLQDIFKTPSRLPRMFWKCLQDVFKTSQKTKNCTSWKTKNCYAQDIFKISLRHALKMLSRCLVDHQTFGGLILFMNFLFLDTVTSLYICFSAIHGILKLCLDLCSKALFRYLGQASETICVALVLHVLMYLNLWLTVLMQPV